MNVQNWLEGMIESINVADEPCDGLDEQPCGKTGSTKLYADGHIFQLCPECAWKLTEEYHEGGGAAPWEGSEA
jgi:hypothetical protein